MMAPGATPFEQGNEVVIITRRPSIISPAGEGERHPTARDQQDVPQDSDRPVYNGHVEGHKALNSIRIPVAKHSYFAAETFSASPAASAAGELTVTTIGDPRNW